MKKSMMFPAVLILLMFAGCKTITYDAQLFEETASMNSGALPGGYSVVGKFKYDMRTMFTAYDLITLKNPAFIEELNKALKVNGGDAVINISIVEETDIVDILIGAFVGSVTQAAFKTSISIFSTRSVVITGDVVKYSSTSHDIPDQETILLASMKQLEK